MSRITKWYKLGLTQSDVDFVDVDMARDNYLFVDPSRIRAESRRGVPLARDAYDSLCRFFDYILASVHGHQPRELGQRALLSLTEPRETRLGMSRRGFHGHGSGEKIGHAIWNEVSTNPLCREEVLVFKRIEHLPLFVEDVDKDRVSDLTTRIVFPQLMEFTSLQADTHSGLAHDCERGTVRTWDGVTGQWAPYTDTVLHPPETERLVLVPRNWVGFNLRMTKQGFVRNGPAGHIQRRETTRDADGNVRKPTKRSILSRGDMREKPRANTSESYDAWSREDRDLVSEYEAHVDSRTDPIAPEDIERRS